MWVCSSPISRHCPADLTPPNLLSGPAAVMMRVALCRHHGRPVDGGQAAHRGRCCPEPGTSLQQHVGARSRRAQTTASELALGITRRADRLRGAARPWPNAGVGWIGRLVLASRMSRCNPCSPGCFFPLVWMIGFAFNDRYQPRNLLAPAGWSAHGGAAFVTLAGSLQAGMERSPLGG